MKIVTVANHSVFREVKRLADSVGDNEFVIGDVGLLPEERIFDNIVQLKYRDYSEDIVTQSPQYRRLISQRPSFIKSQLPCLSMDADTEIIKHDWDMVDFTADLTLTVRSVGPGDHCLDGYDEEYPNLGVVFYHSENCIPFIEEWDRITKEGDPLKQFEQGNFYRAMSHKSFKQLKVQKLHCRYYNCYRREWLKDARIIHYKGYGDFDEKR